MILELGVDVALTLKVSGGGSKIGGIRLLGSNAGRDGATGEKPHADMIRGPFHSIDSTSNIVKSSTIAIGAGGINVATCGAGCEQGAVPVQGNPRVSGTVDLAVIVGVEDHFVARVQVHTFNDIYLSIVRPCPTSQAPKSGPCATRAGRHVFEVDNVKTFIISLFGLNPYTATTRTIDRQRFREVHAEVSVSSKQLIQSRSGSGGLSLVATEVSDGAHEDYLLEENAYLTKPLVGSGPSKKLKPSANELP